MNSLKIFAKVTLMFSLLAGALNTSQAETIQKHPRVAELEDSLRDQASTYLKSRFPEQPFLVAVSVDALRRAGGKNTPGESLPFFDSVSEEIQDEWDDPAVSLHQLQLRTNKIIVEISLSDSISDNELGEVKEAILRNLHLTPARDEIRVEIKNWKGASNRYLLSLMVFGVAILFLMGLYFINRQSTQKITRALTEGSKNSSASAVSMNATSNNSTPDHHHSNDSDHGSKRVNVSDPLRVREIMVKTLPALLQKQGFPTLKHMIMLDDYGHHHPGDLGAILMELPQEMQTKLFSFSSGEWWLKAMTKPNSFSFEHLEFIQKLMKQPDSIGSPSFDEMLIKVWRLNQNLSEFIRNFNKDIGLSILSYLPKGKAIEAARKAYPGAWADLLDPNFTPKAIEESLCNEISEKASQVKPLQNPIAFERHKLEMELRDFLLNAAPEEEREIYLASKPDSAIHEHRPPFYVVLDADEELLKDFVLRFTPEQWALALFNVTQNQRKKIQKFFSEKQNYMFVENLKRIDNKTSEHTPVGKTREFFGKAFKQYKLELESEAIRAMREAQEETKTENEKPDQAA